MGQYHYIVNLDKREFINPHKLGVGLKACEQLTSPAGTAQALFVLLLCSNGRGGGTSPKLVTSRSASSAAGPETGSPSSATTQRITISRLRCTIPCPRFMTSVTRASTARSATWSALCWPPNWA